MSYELFSKMWNSVAGKNSSEDSKSKQQSADDKEKASTSNHNLEPSVKCYVCFSSGQRNIPYRITDLISGIKDNNFKSKTVDIKKPSPFFLAHCPISPADTNMREFAIASGLKASLGKNTAYVLAIGCSAEEFKQHVAEGRLSDFIICAYNAAEFSAVLLGHSTKKNLSQLETIKGKMSTAPIMARDPSPAQRM